MAAAQAQNGFRSEPPSPGRVIPFTFPRFEHFQLSTGLEVYVASLDRGPLLSLHLACPAGAWHDAPTVAGRATLAAELLDEGTDRYTAMEIASRVDDLGGFLATQSDWNAGWISLSLLSRHLHAGLELLAEIALEATFPDSEVERLRQQRLANLKRRLSQPTSLAADAFASAIYSGTAYGQSSLGTPDSVQALDRNGLFDFYRRQFTPLGSTLIATGDLDPKATRIAIEGALGGWTGERPAAAEPIEGLVLEATRILIVDRKDAAQTTLRIGHPSIARTHPDYGALQVLNSLLGGKFTSRINLSLRERLGITYGVSSSFASRLGPGPFQVTTDVETEGAGVGTREVIAELRRLQDERVGEQELQDTKSYLLGVFPYPLQRIDGLASRLADLGVSSLPDDYYDRQLEIVRDLDVETLQSLARRHLQPTRLTVVAVGPADRLQSQFESLGETSIISAEEVLELGNRAD